MQRFLQRRAPLRHALCAPSPASPGSTVSSICCTLTTPLGHRGTSQLFRMALHTSSAASIGCKLSRTEVALRHPRAQPAAQLRVLQWNVLADGLAQHGDFVKVPCEVLEWSFRAPLILAEILESRADLVCLQECNHYDELLALLAPQGYAGAFFAKRCSPACRYDCPPDGMAVFYKAARLQQRGPAHGHAYVSESGQPQSQGFLAVRLHDSLAQQDLLVVTTHLKAKDGEEMDGVRLHQAQQLLGWLDASMHTSLAGAASSSSIQGSSSSQAAGASTSNGVHSPRSKNGVHAPPAATMRSGSNSVQAPAQLGQNSCNGVNGSGGSGERAAWVEQLPVIITGDFNTTSGSPACQALCSHPLGLSSIWSELPDTDCTALDSSNSAAINGSDAPPSLSPATSSVGRAPEFTTWKYRSNGESKRTIDYIFFTPKWLHPISRWHMLTEGEIGPQGLPSARYASDHVAVCVAFEWDRHRDVRPASNEMACSTWVAHAAGPDNDWGTDSYCGADDWGA